MLASIVDTQTETLQKLLAWFFHQGPHRQPTTCRKLFRKKVIDIVPSVWIHISKTVTECKWFWRFSMLEIKLLRSYGLDFFNHILKKQFFNCGRIFNDGILGSLLTSEWWWAESARTTFGSTTSVTSFQSPVDVKRSAKWEKKFLQDNWILVVSFLYFTLATFEEPDCLENGIRRSIT